MLGARLPPFFLGHDADIFCSWQQMTWCLGSILPSNICLQFFGKCFPFPCVQTHHVSLLGSAIAFPVSQYNAIWDILVPDLIQVPVHDSRLANSPVQSQTMGFLGTVFETRLYGPVSKWFSLKGFFLDWTVQFSLIYMEKWGPFLRPDHMVFAKNGPVWTGPFLNLRLLLLL